jgi:EPS-associated MarR family transcriptional regulator
MNDKERNSEEFEILRKINSNPETKQRDLAQQLGFSLGKLNYCIQALKKKGLIKIKNFKKNKNKLNYSYLVTPKGINFKSKMIIFFMQQKMKEYEELKKEIKK